VDKREDQPYRKGARQRQQAPGRALATRTVDGTPISPGAQPTSADYIVVKVAFGSSGEAQAAADQLLAHHLIASGQIAKIQSNYWWEGEVHHEDEYELTCYTRAVLYPRLERMVIDLHSYEVAQVVATPLVYISRAFADWIAQYAPGGESTAT